MKRGILLVSVLVVLCISCTSSGGPSGYLDPDAIAPTLHTQLDRLTAYDDANPVMTNEDGTKTLEGEINASDVMELLATVDLAVELKAAAAAAQE